MNRITVDTGGREIESTFSQLWHYKSELVDKQAASLHLRIGNLEVDIGFGSCSEMIAFCEKHNFKYQDNRSSVQKYLDDLEDLTNEADDVSAFARRQAA